MCYRATRGYYVAKKGAQYLRLVRGGLFEQVTFELSLHPSAPLFPNKADFTVHLL